MSAGRRFVRWYADADWLTHLILFTCLAAAVNFADILVASMPEPVEHVDNFVITSCRLGPPIPFYPRFFALTSLIVGALGLPHRSSLVKLISGAGLAGAVGSYALWWRQSFQIFSAAAVDLGSAEVGHTAYLYQGTTLDIFVVSSSFACLVLVLDRLVTETSTSLNNLHDEL
jgi:hypothetical protein